MNRTVKILIPFLLIFCIAGGLILAVLSYMNDSNKQMPLGIFHEKENSLDGIIIGTSSANRFWIPTEAYENHGAAVGCYASHSIPFVTFKYMIEAVLENQDPEFIAIEIRNISQDPETRETEHITDLTDHMPPTLTRLKVIREILKFAEKFDTDISSDPRQYRYPESDEEVSRSKRYCEAYSIYKGYPVDRKSFKKAKLKNSIEWSEDMGDMPYDTEETMNDLMDYCEKLDCDVIFYLSPCALKYDRQVALNKALRMAEKRGFITKNFNLDNEKGMIGLRDGDYYDDIHTNVYGAVKFTEYMYQYLDNLYNLEDHRGDNTYKSWDAAAELFRTDIKITDPDISFEMQ